MWHIEREAWTRSILRNATRTKNFLTTVARYETVNQVWPSSFLMMNESSVEQIPLQRFQSLRGPPSSSLPQPRSNEPLQPVAEQTPDTESTAPPETAVTQNDQDLEASSLLRTPAKSSPLKQSLIPWGSAVVTTALYCMTVCYALGTTQLRYLSFVSLDPTRSLRLIRILSEFTSFFLGLLIGQCTERALWMFVTSGEGTFLATFLALHWGSGIWAWCKLIAGNVLGGRTLSWLKIIIMVAIPAINIILLSDVKPEIYFDDQSSFPVAAGVGNFDPSFAIEYEVVIPTLVTTDYSSLLRYGDVSWSVPVVGQDSTNCTSTDPFSKNFCGHGYFIHGGLKLVTPWPTENKSLPDSSIYTIHSIRGVELDFTNLEPDTRIRGEQDCIVVGTEEDSIQICISQYSKNAISATYVNCPFATRGSCQTESSWRSSTGWATTMTAYVRHATAHFSRSNLSAVAVTDFSSPVEYLLSASDMLSVLNLTFNAKTSLGRPLDSAIDLIRFIDDYLAQSIGSVSTSAQALLSLHNLMAMPIYYFQPTYLSPYTVTPFINSPNSRLPKDQELYTTASLSTYYYGLSIAPWTICTYTVGLGLILCLCLLTLFFGSIPVTAGAIPNTTAWPFLDVAAESRLVQLRDGDDNAQNNNETIHDMAQRVKFTNGFKAKARAMSEIKVKLITDKTQSMNP